MLMAEKNALIDNLNIEVNPKKFDETIFHQKFQSKEYFTYE